MLRELLETILKEVPNADDPEVAYEINEIFRQKLPELLEELANDKGSYRYEAEGNAGTPGIKAKDELGYLPIVYLDDTYAKTTDKFNAVPYYIMFILREDRKGIYLSLNHSQQYMKNLLEEKEEWDSWFSGNLEGSLLEETKKIRTEITEIPEGFSEFVNLGSEHAKSGKVYEAATILAKYYTLADLPSEADLISDFNSLLKIYKEILAIDTEITRIWKIAPGDYKKRQVMWPIFKEKGYVGVGWFACEDLMKKSYKSFKSYEDLHDVLKKCANRPTVGTAARMIWNFTNEIQIGDIVIANDGYKGILGIGVVKSGYIGPNASFKLKLDPDNEIFHFREVEWLITDPIEMENDHFFAQQTITPIDLQKWNQIKETYMKNSKDYREIFQYMEDGDDIEITSPIDIVKQLFNQFKEDYLDTEAGQNHLNAHKDVKKDVEKYFDEIKNNREIKNNIEDPIINYLLPIKGKFVAPAGVNDIKAYGYSKEELPGLTEAVFNLINNLIETDDENTQKRLIHEFKTSKFSKGFQTGMLTPVLYYLNPDYYYINRKNVDTFNFLTEILGEDKKINGYLEDYVESKSKIKSLMGELSNEIPEISNFEVFDVFCHWMCEKGLGYYAIDREKYEKWYRKTFGGLKPDVDIRYLDLQPFDLSEIDLTLDPRINEQVCGTLNAGKHVMFTGAPGTGKTHFAEKICDIAVSGKFIDDYILTTATSDWTTFDTIGGYMPDEDGKLCFEEGKFLQAIRENSWLIIDEINRADIDKAFGQLFTVLSGQGVELPYKIDGMSVKIKRCNKNKCYYDQKTATYYVGKNWRILATMNVYDKDYLFEMSYAFMRRFTFIYIELPETEEFKNLIRYWSKSLNVDQLAKIEALLKINKERQLGPAIFKDIVEYVEERHRIGSDKHVIEDAVLSFIMPQFEGLEKAQVQSIGKILKETFEDTNELEKRMFEITTIQLDD